MKKTRTPTRARAMPRRAQASLQYRICRSADVAPGESRKFMMPIRGADEECFVVNYGGHYYAYVNRCRHVPIPMDWVDNQFFGEQGRYLVCQTHNAYYQPDSGECVAGPPGTCGKSLYRVPLEVRDETIYARPPLDEFDD